MMPIRIGVVGMGSAGSMHARVLAEGRVPGATLAAVVCRPERLASASYLSRTIRHFDSLSGLLAETPHCCDAVIVATPHKLHPEQTIAALSAGLHVLSEKPAGVSTREARAMTEAAERSGRIYSLNFNRRTVPLYQEIRRRVIAGEIGDLRRVNWTSTAWLRVQAYYDSSPWRGTWEGEGGGLLLNQLPHVLDLWQWICGMPVRLRAYCGFGKHHNIEVEDEISLFAEYANGATAVLTASTSEVPGTERLEIVGDRGSLVAENGRLHIRVMEEGTIGAFIASAPAGFPHPRMQEETVVLDGEGDLITGITIDFVNAVAKNDTTSPLAPGRDGAASLMIANAALLSGWQDGAWVRLPMDSGHENEFERRLAALKGVPSATQASHRETQVLNLEESF
jgi:predicted dehydrogenase